MAGDIAVRRFEFEYAKARYEAALLLDPARWTSWSNLSSVARYLGDWPLQVKALRNAFERCDDDERRAKLHSNYLVHLHASPDLDAKAVRQSINAWSTTWQTDRREAPHAQQIKIASPIRVAFASGHFHGPILSALLPSVLNAFDATRVSLALVDTRLAHESSPQPAWSESLIWRKSTQINISSEFAGQFDVWVDLDGHAPTGTLHRLPTRVAPIQISWLDWFNTTGAANFDYWLGDADSNPPALDALFCEQVWRLPHFRLPYCPHPALASIAMRKRQSETPMRFGAFGRIDKHHPALFDVWSDILKALPKSVIVFKAGVFDSVSFQTLYRAHFAARGVPPEQLAFLGNDNYQSHLAAYAQIDAVLDPFPYNGGVSTFDALAMGVPVICQWGELPVARQSAALMKAVGLERFATTSLQDYVRIAVEIGRAPATSLPEAEEVRSRLLATPMTQPSVFAEHLTQAILAMTQLSFSRAQ